jgi:predicted oxidoreductase
MSYDIGQSGRSIEIRIKEHNRHIRLAQPNKSAVAEYSINREHIINLQDTTLLSAKTGYMDRILRKPMNLECDRLKSRIKKFFLFAFKLF